MALATHKITGIPLAEGLENTIDLPHSISYAILYRERIDSFNELPKDKRPRRHLWDKPFALSEYLDTIWEKDGPTQERNINYIDIMDEELE